MTESRRQSTNRFQRGCIYSVLVAFGVFMLFPFVYMITASLKTSEDIFRYPPRLLPYTQQTTVVDEQELPLYAFSIEGQTRYLIETDEQVAMGFFSITEQIDVESPRSSVVIAQVPLDETQPTGETITLMRVNGQTRTFEMYRVTTEAEPLVLALAYQGMMNIFVDPTDTTVSAFAFSRLATPVEHITFEWQNYEEVLGLGLGQVFINTVIVTVGVVGGQLLTSIMGGYAFARLTFVGRSRLFLLYLGSIMIPFVVLIVPLYRLMIWLGWQGELVALIIPWMFTAYGTFLMRQAFLTIPADLEDAARMDGANRWRILWSILVPLSKPAIATLAVFSFLYAWNSFLWPLLIIGQGNADSHVLTLALSRLNAAYDQRPNLVMAGAVITILPPLVVFLLAQKYFIEGFATSGIKG